ncbi:MAG: hypothetical protein ACRENC_11850 [Gemmatimonadaceae bacterium]
MTAGERQALGLSHADAELLARIRAAAQDRGRHPSRHDPRVKDMVEGRQGANLACTGKTAWFSQPEHAAKAARDCAEKYGEPFTYYLCAYCNRYHLTTKQWAPRGG